MEVKEEGQQARQLQVESRRRSWTGGELLPRACKLPESIVCICIYTYTNTNKVYRRLARHSPRAEANNAIARNGIGVSPTAVGDTPILWGTVWNTPILWGTVCQ